MPNCEFEAASSATVFTVAGGDDEDLYQLRLGNRFPDELELTPEQAEKIQALVKAFREAIKADREALKAIISEAKQAKEDGKSDADIKAILDKGTPIAAKLAAAGAKLKTDIDAILTAEQRAWLASHEPKNCNKNRFPPLTDEQKTKIKGFEAAFNETSKADKRALITALKEIKKAALDGVSAADIQKLLDGIKPAIDRLADGARSSRKTSNRCSPPNRKLPGASHSASSRHSRAGTRRPLEALGVFSFLSLPRTFGDLMRYPTHRHRLVERAMLCSVLLASIAGCSRATGAQGTAAVKPPPPAPVRADTASLRRVLDSIADAHHGVVGYSVIDLENNATISRRGDETFPTASLIKVAVLVTVYDLVAKGDLSLDDPLTVLKIDQVPGSGITQYLHRGSILTVHDAAWLMITISDNTTTNLLLDRIIIRRVWDKMEALGLKHTKIHSKTFRRNSSVAMDSSVKYGLGVTTPNEMARLLELLARGKAVSAKADSEMIDMLEHNNTDVMLLRFADGARVAHKDGETDQVRTECGVFYLRNRIAACVLTKENKDTRWIVDNEAQLTVARMGEAIVKAWGGVPPAPPE